LAATRCQFLQRSDDISPPSLQAWQTLNAVCHNPGPMEGQAGMEKGRK
jgi:hypothetical protein